MQRILRKRVITNQGSVDSELIYVIPATICDKNGVGSGGMNGPTASDLTRDGGRFEGCSSPVLLVDGEDESALVSVRHENIGCVRQGGGTLYIVSNDKDDYT